MKMEISFFSSLSQPAHYYAVVQSQSPLPSGMSTGKILDWSIANPAPSGPSVPLLDLLAFGRFIANDLTSSRCFLHGASHVRWTPKNSAPICIEVDIGQHEIVKSKPDTTCYPCDFSCMQNACLRALFANININKLVGSLRTFSLYCVNWKKQTTAHIFFHLSPHLISFHIYFFNW